MVIMSLFCFGCGNSIIKSDNLPGQDQNIDNSDVVKELELFGYSFENRDVAIRLNKNSIFSDYLKTYLKKTWKKTKYLEQIKITNIDSLRDRIPSELNIKGKNIKIDNIEQVKISDTSICYILYGGDKMVVYLYDSNKKECNKVIDKDLDREYEYVGFLKIGDDIPVFAVVTGSGGGSGWSGKIFAMDSKGKFTLNKLEIGGWLGHVDYVDLDNDGICEIINNNRSVQPDEKDPSWNYYFTEINVFKYKNSSFINVGKVFVPESSKSKK